jgi:hypothetical protein
MAEAVPCSLLIPRKPIFLLLMQVFCCTTVPADDVMHYQRMNCATSNRKRSKEDHSVEMSAIAPADQKLCVSLCQRTQEEYQTPSHKTQNQNFLWTKVICGPTKNKAAYTPAASAPIVRMLLGKFGCTDQTPLCEGAYESSI